MNALSTYWTMWCISPGHDRRGYQRQIVLSAQDFCQTYLQRTQKTKNEKDDAHSNRFGDKRIQASFLNQFRSQEEAIAPLHRAKAGLCLRCYVSESILKACKQITWKFTTSQAFSYQDLLPFVLNDNGKTLVILADDDKTQQVVKEDEQLQPTDFRIFAVDVLRTYRLDDNPDGVDFRHHSRMSLENWTYLQTKQQPELKKFLAEFGFKAFGDWALLNRASVGQIKQLSERDRHLVEAFHLVYRRDRQQQPHKGRCPDPNAAQWAEMSKRLQKRGIEFNSSVAHMKALKHVAQQLRQFDIWQSREPLEMKDQAGDYHLRTDLPTNTLGEDDIEEQELTDFLRQQLYVALDDAIAEVIQRRMAKLCKSKKYAPFAECFTTGLLRYYGEGRSLKEIGPELGMSSWDQTRRILNPGDLVKNVRRLTAQQLLERILQKAHDKGLMTASPAPDYLKTLAEEVERFIDAEIFEQALSEIKAGKNRSLDSEYATHLIDYLQQPIHTFGFRLELKQNNET